MGREPVASLFSTFHFYHKQTVAFTEAGNISEFIQTPEKYCRDNTTYSMFCHNHMLFDLGYNVAMKDDHELQTTMHEIDGLFDLVLIQDRMPESLILLKHALKLTYLEVLSFHTNTAIRTSK